VAQIMTTGGIAAGRLKAEGYGWERPLADNNTEAGRARNRRLEMVVVPR
jgi:OOP family OmpA-OmpF porin